jgi:NAD(P)-dependent dehydrogenase (short-subunit alcohol dehydrogenase family)
MNDIQNRVSPLLKQHAVITGASRGLGRAIARELYSLGASVTLIARTESSLRETAASLPPAHDKGYLIAAADVTDGNALKAAIDEGQAKFGAATILVNNAGAAEGVPFLKMDMALWERTFALNVTSAVIATQHVLGEMMQAGHGRIVNLASVAGLKGVAYACAYTASKHALIGLTRSLALECARKGVTVNAVCPGYADTPMLEKSVRNIVDKTSRPVEDVRKMLSAGNPQGRFVTAEEVAAAVGWLCLPSAASINGIALPIAGGEV